MFFAAELDNDWVDIQGFLSNIKGVMTESRRDIVVVKYTSGMLMGNGDIGVVAGDSTSTQKFYFAKGNFIWGEGYRGSYGIRVSGTGHKVINNYITDVSGPGIMIRAGEYVDTFITESYNPLNRAGVPIGRVPRYSWVRDCIFANNTIVNVGGIGISFI